MKGSPSDNTASAGSPSSPSGDLARVLAGLPVGIWLGLLIVLATAVAYWPAYSAGFIWDDDDYVTQNQTLRDLPGLCKIWFDPTATPQYYPLVHTTFWVEYHLWGLNPLGYHVVNVLLHAIGAVLLWRILLLLKVPGAWLAAAVFALHPVQVESVAWITERKNVLSGLLCLSATLCYFRFSPLDAHSQPPPHSRRWYFAAFAVYVAALLSKTVVCSLPVALLLVYWWKRDKLAWRDILPLAPFFVAGLALGLSTAWLEQHHVGAHGSDWNLTFADRILIAGRALCFYVAKLFWPVPLVFNYPHWDINRRIWWQWLFPVIVGLIAVGLWAARYRIGKGPLIACGFFCGVLAPALGFINTYPMRFSYVADHFQYLASIGVIAATIAAVVYYSGLGQIGKLSSGVSACLVLLVLGTLTWRQCGIYKNLETLWTDTLTKNPRSWLAHTNLGRLQAQQNHFAEAESNYLAAQAIDSGVETTHYNYGNLLVKTGRLDEAIKQYQLALQIEPAKADVHNNLGSIYVRQHRWDDAAAEFQSAIQSQPDDADAYFNLGSVLAVEHKMDAAIDAYRQALRLKPDSEVFRRRLQSLGVPVN